MFTAKTRLAVAILSFLATLLAGCSVVAFTAEVVCGAGYILVGGDDKGTCEELGESIRD